MASLKAELPDLRVMSKATLKKGLVSYVVVGWTGYVPEGCRNAQIHVPEKYAPLLWGWPDRFLNRMERAGSRVILVAGDGDFSKGFDEVADLQRLPAGYTGGIWTNRVDRIGPLVKPTSPGLGKRER